VGLKLPSSAQTEVDLSLPPSTTSLKQQLVAKLSKLSKREKKNMFIHLGNEMGGINIFADDASFHKQAVVGSGSCDG
jgi:hypothetical protein